MKNVSSVVSQSANRFARKLRFAPVRSRLIALLALVGIAAALTLSTTSYAKRLVNSVTLGLTQNKAAAKLAKPTLTTDRGSYLAGETITFAGANWAPGEAVTIVISAVGSKGGTTIQAVANKLGSFTATSTMPDVRAVNDADKASGRKAAPHIEESEHEGRSFTATATGSSSRAKAQAEFAAGIADRDGERLLDQEGYWIHRQTYPTNRFNPEWVRKAAEQDARVLRGIPAGRKLDSRSLADNPLALSPTGFTALGPAPERMTGCTGCFDYTTTAGRINDIKIDPVTPTVAYAASVGGGVWKTTNCCSGSTSWTVMTDDALVSTTNIDSLTIDPNNHNTIYAGTGDLNYGSFSMGSQGILKSTDAGATWTVLGAGVFGAALPVPVGQFPQYQAVGKVRVDPNNSNNVVAGTKTGLYLSYDGGANWTGPCLTNSFSTMRQDITGLELSNISGTTRIVAAVGVRGFATTVQFNLDQNGANGLYKGTIPASGCPTDFASISNNANGFVYGAAAAPYGAGANMNATSGSAYVNSTTGNQIGRIDIAIAPSDPNYIYAQVGSITPTTNSGCGTNTLGCQLGVWSSTDGGTSWSFMVGSAGASLAACAASGAGSAGAGSGDYPQNWYDQAVAVDPNDKNRIFVSTFDVWLATRTGTTFYDVTCGYTGVDPKPVHVDQHALAFVPGSSSMLLLGNDGGVHGTTNADAAVPATSRPTWFNMDTGFNTVEFYSGDISGFFATASNPSANGGAQDNGPSAVIFSGSPTGPAPWQMGLGGDGFFARIDPVGQGPTSASGTITLTTGGALAGETFVIGPQTFTWQVAARTGTGQVQINASTTTAGNNIVAAIAADLVGVATSVRSGARIFVTASSPGAGGNSIAFTEASTNMTVNGSGTLGGTTPGGIPSARYWQGNNSGGVSRCLSNCTSPGATWTSRRGNWTGDQQSFILPWELFHGDTTNPANDCGAPALQTGCGHLIAGTIRVWETLTGATTGTNTWYVNSPANLTKGTLGNRSFINQLAFEPKDQNTVVVGTNDGNVQIGRNLGTGSNQSIWVDVTGGNSVLPNRPILDVAFDPTTTTAPIAYAAVGGFNENTPSQPGHVLRVVCTANCASFTWTDKSGNLPNIPVDSIIANPNFAQQIFAGTDFGLYYTDDVTAATPVWYRFNVGLPNVMIWDMQTDRGGTTLSLWTRSRGAFVWPLPQGRVNLLSQTITVNTHAPASAVHGSQFTVAATSNSGLPVSYSSSGACTNSGPTFTMISGTGNCLVKYDQVGDQNYAPAAQVVETVAAQDCPSPTNVARASFGATATASSEFSAAFPASGVIDGEHNGNTWGSGGGWNDRSRNMFPDDVQVNLNVMQTIGEIDVYTLKNDFNSGSVVNDTTTFTSYGITNFNVQYWTGTAWADVPGGAVTGNNLVKRKFIFPDITTDKIRVLVTASADSVYSRVVEVEAFACNAVPTPTPSPTPCASPSNNVALASNGSTAVGSTTFSAAFPASGAIDGEHNGNTWGAGGGWNDRSRNLFPDDIQVNFNVNQTIREIDVYTLKNDFNSGSVVTDATTFTSYGITDFTVQYWTGVAWANVPGGVVTGNNLVKRKFIFPNITTDKIRVVITASADNVYSRVVEIEAFACAPVMARPVATLTRPNFAFVGSAPPIHLRKRGSPL